MHTGNPVLERCGRWAFSRCFHAAKDLVYDHQEVSVSQLVEFSQVHSYSVAYPLSTVNVHRLTFGHNSVSRRNGGRSVPAKPYKSAGFCTYAMPPQANSSQPTAEHMFTTGCQAPQCACSSSCSRQYCTACLPPNRTTSSGSEIPALKGELSHVGTLLTRPP